MNYQIGDIVAMKKLHACQTSLPVKQQKNEWEITRVGADIKIRCCHCQRMVMMPRPEFDKKLKKIIRRKEEKSCL